MPLNLLNLPATEAERLAYAEGFTMAAELFARIAELEAELKYAHDEIERLEDIVKNDSLERWENENGPADAYKQFFEDCFEHLAGHYPAPSVTSDYDQSVIFEAIEKGAAE